MFCFHSSLQYLTTWTGNQWVKKHCWVSYLLPFIVTAGVEGDRANMVKRNMLSVCRTLSQARHKAWHQDWPIFSNWCEICNSSYCFLPWTHSLGGEGKKQKKERGGKKLKCLVLSQAYSCSSEQQNLQVFPFSVTSFQNKIYHNTSHVQRSPLADLHRQVTTSQLLLPSQGKNMKI